MRLRSITKHIKDQNWFAVALDFFIVVVGILLAFQITNWGEASMAKDKERVILEQLHSEFSTVLDTMREAKEHTDKSITATRDILRVIRDDAEPTDKAAFLETLRLANGLNYGPNAPTILTELLSSGGLSYLSSPTLRTSLVRYRETSIEIADTGAVLLQRISEPHSGLHKAIYVNPNFETYADILYKYNWDDIPATREQYQILLYGKTGIAESMEHVITIGETVLSEIKAAQK